MLERDRFIYDRCGKGETFALLAREFGISSSRVSQIYYRMARVSAFEKKCFKFEQLVGRSDILSVELFDVPFFHWRPVNILRSEGVITFGDLVVLSERDLLRMPNFGRMCLAQTKDVLKRVKLSLKDYL